MYRTADKLYELLCSKRYPSINYEIGTREVAYICRSYKCLPALLTNYNSWEIEEVLDRGNFRINLRKRFGQYVLTQLLRDKYGKGLDVFLDHAVGNDKRYGEGVLKNAMNNAILEEQLVAARLLMIYGAYPDYRVLHERCLSVRSLEFIFTYFQFNVDHKSPNNGERYIDRLCREYNLAKQRYRGEPTAEIISKVYMLLDNGASTTGVKVGCMERVFKRYQRPPLGQRMLRKLERKQITTLFLINRFSGTGENYESPLGSLSRELLMIIIEILVSFVL